MLTHTFNGPFSGTTWVSRYQKGKTNLDFTEARDSEWQRHQLGHMQVCISLKTDNHASTPTLKFFTGRMPFLPPNQQRQSTNEVKTVLCKKSSTTTTTPRQPGQASTRKVKPSLDLMWKEVMWFWDGSGISWTICKQSAPRSRHITIINTSSLNFYKPDVLADTQPTASKQ